MRRILQFSVLTIVILVFIACDKVDKNEVIKSRDVIIDGGGGFLDTLSFPDSTARVVLLEDFTGHTCGNCPAAHTKAQELYNKYPGKVIVTGVHCGSFAIPYPSGAPKYTYDFRTPAAENMDFQFKCSDAGLPKGLVNRRFDIATNAFPLDFGKWEAEILKEFQKKSIYKIESKALLSNDSTSISLSAKFKFLQATNDTLKYSVYILEDSIIAWQKDYSKPIGSQDLQTYAHRHVFRKAITNELGDVLSSTAHVRKDSIVKTFTIPIDSKWNKKKLSVVTFVSRKSQNKSFDFKILQANEVKVK